MTLVYVVRTFPKLSESFVLREVLELARRGEPLIVWSLVPADRSEAPPDEGTQRQLAGLVHRAPAGRRGAVRLLASAVAALARAPRRSVPTLAWCARWAVHERDARHLAAFPYAAYLAARLPPDAHLHAHFANAPTTVAIAAARLSETTVSFTGHARDLFVATSRAFLAEKVRRSAFTAVETDYAANRVRALVAQAEAEGVLVVRNGLARSEQRPERRTPEPGLIVSVGRLVPKKGHDLLIEAIAELALTGADVRCEIVGEGPERARLEALVDQRGLAGRVLLRGAAGRDVVDDSLARAEVFVLACRIAPDGDADGLPLAILEAMSASVPVVTTPVAGIPEVVIEGNSGLLVPMDDAGALATALRRVLTDATLRLRLVTGAHRALSPFEIECCVDRLLDAFRVAIRP